MDEQDAYFLRRLTKRIGNVMNSPTVRFTKFHGNGVAKSYVVVDDALQKNPAPNFGVGTFETITVTGVRPLREFIEALKPGDFLTAGVHRAFSSGVCGLGNADVHRTKETFHFASGRPGLMIIDGDNLDKMGIADSHKFASALEKLVRGADYVLSPSASSGITYNGVEGPIKGIHAFLFVEDAASIPATLEALHKRSVLLGYAWALISESGTVLIRSLVDCAMKTPNQPCFEGGAILGTGITQTRKVEATRALDSMMFVKVAPLTGDEEAAFELEVKRLEATVAKEADEKRAAWRSKRYEKMIAKGCPPENAVRILDAALSGNCPVLYGDHEIQTDNYGVLTVREILADRVKYHEATCHDPLDWSYGKNKAKIYSNNSTSPAIHSFAHGEKTYILEQDFFALTASRPGSPESFWASGIFSAAALDVVDRTDAGNVAVLAKLTAGNLRFVLEHKKWLGWNGSRWQVDNGGPIAHEQGLLVAEYYQRLEKKMRGDAKDGSLSDEERKRLESNARSLQNWSRQCRNKVKLDAMLGLAQRDRRFILEANQLDQNHWLLGVANGVVDLRTGLLRPDSREDFVTKRTPVAFNPKATAPRWELFIRQVTSTPDGFIQGKVKPKERPSLAMHVQKALGYSCTGSTREHVMCIAWGGGSNGKNVLLDNTKSVMGGYAETISPAVLMAAKFDNGADQASPSIRKLAGARVAFSSESKENQKLDVSVVKCHTGGGFMTARGLHENPLTFQITHKLWLMTNHAPKLDHMDEATKGRLHLIPFDMKWNRPVDVKPDPTFPDAQKDLMDVLAGEREGILLWLIAGAVEYCKTGLAPPPEVVALTRNYLDSQDMLKSWLREYETCQPADGMVAAELFDQYRTFCNDEGGGTNITNAAQLGKRLKKLGHLHQKGREGSKYGLKKTPAALGQMSAGLAEILADWDKDDQPEGDPAGKCVTV